MYIRDCLRVCHNVRWLLPIQTSSVEIPIVAALCIDANWYFPQIFAVNTLKIHHKLQRLPAVVFIHNDMAWDMKTAASAICTKANSINKLYNLLRCKEHDNGHAYFEFIGNVFSCQSVVAKCLQHFDFGAQR